MKKQTPKKNTDRFRKISNPQIFTEEEISLSNAKVNIHIRLDSALNQKCRSDDATATPALLRS
jgi:hypothetical protein